MKFYFIYRAERFSPNSVENDHKILDAVASEIKLQGNDVSFLTEEKLVENAIVPEADVVFTMARSNEALEILARSKARIINNPKGIALCSNRIALCEMMNKCNVPVPPADGNDGVWLKKGIGCAEVPEDTVFCQNEDEVSKAMAQFAARGITDVCRQAHVKGDLVKFYGVGETEFFHYLYPTDCGRSKFGQEARNGKAHHYAFSVNELKSAADCLAKEIGVLAYGGDAIVTASGDFYIIDFNDWPTFSPCMEKAAHAIADAACAAIGK